MRDSVLILSTGTELAGGRSRDSNGPEIAETLVEQGFSVLGIRIVPDDPELLHEEVARAVAHPRVSALVMTGGLGPTADDHTVEVLARITGRAIVEEPSALRKMELLAKRWRRRFNIDAARRQARILEGAEVLRNEKGLAPGIVLPVGTSLDTCLVAAMPGVPQEMRPMFERELLPRLRSLLESHARARRVFYLYGVGESNFQGEFFAREDGAPALPKDLVWGVTAARGYIRLFFESEEVGALEVLMERARSLYPESFLAEPVLDIFPRRLVERGETLAVAESCTGGWIGKMLTDRPGASTYFLGGLISYANSAKQALLDVPSHILEEEGAVSRSCALAMARGVRARFSSTYGIAVTGIAGPDGGTKEKPVGTVFIAAVGPAGEVAQRLDLPMDRERVREYSAHLALFHGYRAFFGL